MKYTFEIFTGYGSVRKVVAEENLDKAIDYLSNRKMSFKVMKDHTTIYKNI